LFVEEVDVHGPIDLADAPQLRLGQRPDLDALHRAGTRLIVALHHGTGVDPAEEVGGNDALAE
jgi:hypothetical protein